MKTYTYTQKKGREKIMQRIPATWYTGPRTRDPLQNLSLQPTPLLYFTSLHFTSYLVNFTAHDSLWGQLWWCSYFCNSAKSPVYRWISMTSKIKHWHWYYHNIKRRNAWTISTTEEGDGQCWRSSVTKNLFSSGLQRCFWIMRLLSYFHRQEY